MKTIKKTSLALICLIVFVASAVSASALTTWTHNITGTVPGNDMGFQVYKDSACSIVWDGNIASTVTNLAQPFSETYYIKNLSNGPVTVMGSVSAGSTTYTWVDGKSSLSLAVGEVGSLTLTLNNYNGGVAGPFTVAVTFNKA